MPPQTKRAKNCPVEKTPVPSAERKKTPARKKTRSLFCDFEDTAPATSTSDRRPRAAAAALGAPPVAPLAQEEIQGGDQAGGEDSSSDEIIAGHDFQGGQALQDGPETQDGLDFQDDRDLTRWYASDHSIHSDDEDDGSMVIPNQSLTSVPTHLRSVPSLSSVPTPLRSVPSLSSVPTQLTSVPSLSSVPTQLTSVQSPSSMPTQRRSVQGRRFVPRQLTSVQSLSSVPTQLGSVQSHRSVQTLTRSYGTIWASAYIPSVLTERFLVRGNVHELSTQTILTGECF